MAMRAGAVLAAAVCLAAGVLVARAAPRDWRIDPWQGVLLGSSFYMGVLHRWFAWRSAPRTITARAGRDRGHGVWSLVWRIAAFLGLLVGQAVAYFEWLPVADMRAPFILLSVWIVAETMLDPARGATSLSPGGPSPRV